jgi:hypothetical protein
MTTSGYPDMRSDCFADVINRYRCPCIAEDGRRCQLWAGHTGRGLDHAAAALNGLPPTTMRRPRRGVLEQRPWLRWSDDGRMHEQPAGSERLPWAAFGSK